MCSSQTTDHWFYHPLGKIENSKLCQLCYILPTRYQSCDWNFIHNTMVTRQIFFIVSRLQKLSDMYSSFIFQRIILESRWKKNQFFLNNKSLMKNIRKLCFILKDLELFFDSAAFETTIMPLLLQFFNQYFFFCR